MKAIREVEAMRAISLGVSVPGLIHGSNALLHVLFHLVDYEVEAWQVLVACRDVAAVVHANEY